MTIEVTGNRISGIPEGAKVLVRLQPFYSVPSVIEIAVAFVEEIDVQILTDEHLQSFKVPCEPDYQQLGDGLIIAVDQDYRRLRQADYPSIGDQLDAIMKGGAEFEAMQAKCRAVKDRYRKNSED